MTFSTLVLAELGTCGLVVALTSFSGIKFGSIARAATSASSTCAACGSMVLSTGAVLVIKFGSTSLGSAGTFTSAGAIVGGGVLAGTDCAASADST